MDFVQQIQDEIKSQINEALEAARNEGLLDFKTVPDFVIEVPRQQNFGDFATNVAMLLAKEAKKNPREIAQTIIGRLEVPNHLVAGVETAGAGFINFRLSPAWLYQVPPQILEEDLTYGRDNLGRGAKIQVEFVSANPTGLLHMGNARGAALGDTIASLLEAVGYDVTREFYINDAGNQIQNFGKSLEARYLQALGHDVPVPDEGYHGVDLVETIRGLTAKIGNKYEDTAPELRREMLVRYALEEKLQGIKQSLQNFGVKYDVWFSEQSLHDSGEIEQVIRELQEKGYIYEKEGALWFKSTQFGDEKDEVVVRKNGIPTYFAADIAYHRNKFERGFEEVINIWGADHHGHVSRMKGAVQALGYDPDRLKIILMQMVRLFSGGEILRMSKRTGQYVTLDELLLEVGVDAARYFFLSKSHDATVDFDLDLAKSQSSDNPVYYVQYAHARIMSILRAQAAAGEDLSGPVNFSLLAASEEHNLIRKLADFPGVVKGAALAAEPHRLPAYAQQLASLFHNFYTNCRVLTEDPELKKARLALCRATQITLRNLLSLMGVSAPERM